jgi:stage V sporulation protein G
MGIAIKIRQVFNDTSHKKAVMSVVIDGWYVSHGLVLIQRDDGRMYLGMPGKVDSSGVYRDIFHPITREAREALEAAAIAAYQIHPLVK